jgi:hypothetical protein
MSSIIVEWDKMGSEFTYRVYYSKHKAGPWIRAHDFRLIDDNIDLLRANYPAPYNEGGVYGSDGQTLIYSNNLFMITGLAKGTTYHVKVEANDKYHQWWYSYEGENSLGGGESEPHNRPSPSGNNSLGLQFEVL